MLSRVKTERAAWIVFAILASAFLFERFASEGVGVAVLAVLVPRGVWLLVAALVAMAALLARSTRAIAVAIPCLFLAIVPLGGLELSTGGRTDVNSALRVVQYNVNKWDAGTGPIAQSIAKLSPDVVCLEEAGTYSWLTRADQKPEGLSASLQGYKLVGRDEVRIATKLPIVAEHVGPLPPGPLSRPLVETVVKTPKGELSIIAVHLIPTLPFESWSADRGDVSSGSLVDIAHARHVQLQNLRAYVEKLHRPAVVCGDFNAPATSPAIHVLDGVLEDAFRVRGDGFGWTAPVPLAQLRIDYVFVRGLDVVKVEVGSAATSDHYPLVADVVVR